MTTTNQTTTQEIVSAYSVFVEECKKHTGDNYELVVQALAHLEEVDTVLGVLTDPSPVDVESVLKQVGIIISTGEISDHMWKIQHPEPEEIPAPVVDPTARLNEDSASALAALVRSELPEGYKVNVSPAYLDADYWNLGVFPNEVYSSCMFTLNSFQEWEDMKSFLSAWSETIKG